MRSTDRDRSQRMPASAACTHGLRSTDRDTAQCMTASAVCTHGLRSTDRDTAQRMPSSVVCTRRCSYDCDSECASAEMTTYWLMTTNITTGDDLANQTQNYTHSHRIPHIYIHARTHTHKIALLHNFLPSPSGWTTTSSTEPSISHFTSQ